MSTRTYSVHTHTQVHIHPYGKPKVTDSPPPSGYVVIKELTPQMQSNMIKFKVMLFYEEL